MKLCVVAFSTPYEENNEVIIPAETVQAAKELFQKVLTQNTYYKVPYKNKEMIVLSSSIQIKKVTIQKKA